MKRSRIAILSLACLALAMPLCAQTFVSQGRAGQLDGDTTWNVSILGDPDERACAYLVFEFHDGKNYRALKLANGAMFLVKVENGLESFVGTGVGFEPYRGQGYVVTIRRRASTLAVIVDGTRYLNVTDAAAAPPGAFGYKIEPEGAETWFSVAASSWTKAAEIQLERRFSLESGESRDHAPVPWDVLRGAWLLKPARGEGEFSPVGRYVGRNGIVLTGEATWDDYAARLAVRLDGPRASAGLVFYALSSDRYYLLRMASDNGRVRLELVKVKDGAQTILKMRPTALAPEQWYELKVAVAEDAVKSYVDGQFAFLAYDDELVGGRVGLCAQGPDASSFDGLIARSLRLSRSEFLEDRDGRFVQLAGAASAPMASQKRGILSLGRAEWRREDTPDGVLFENTDDYWGNVALKWEPRRPMIAGASAALTIGAEEGDANSGYALSLLFGEDAAAMLRFLRAGREVGTKHLKGNAANPLRVAFAKSDTVITARVNGEPVIEFSDPDPLGGARLRFYTDLPFTDAPSDLRVENESACTETFVQAPVNWIAGAGKWEVFAQTHALGFLLPSIRNVPASAFSPAPSILWNKGAYGGDLTLEYEAACFQANPEGIFPPNLNVAICADGRDLASGYCVIFSPTSYPGQPAWPIRLTRQGKVVAETKHFLYEDLSPSGDDAVGPRLAPMGGWWRLRLQKRGESLRFFVNDRLALEYRDRKPLTGSRLGLWTLGTPMAVSRVRIAWSPGGFAAAGTSFALHKISGGGEPLTPGEAKVVNAQCGGPFELPLAVGPLKAGAHGRASLQFDFKADPDTGINLYFRLDGRPYVIPLTGPEEHPRDVTVLSRLRPTGRPGGWQSVSVNFADVLARASAEAAHPPKAGSLRVPPLAELKAPQSGAVVSGMRLGHASSQWRLAAGLSGNRIGAAYFVRNLYVNGE